MSHVCPDGHVPQLNVLLQPSGGFPQVALRLVQVSGLHTPVQTLDVFAPVAATLHPAELQAAMDQFISTPSVKSTAGENEHVLPLQTELDDILL